MCATQRPLPALPKTLFGRLRSNALTKQVDRVFFGLQMLGGFSGPEIQVFGIPRIKCRAPQELNIRCTQYESSDRIAAEGVAQPCAGSTSRDKQLFFMRFDVNSQRGPHPPLPTIFLSIEPREY